MGKAKAKQAVAEYYMSMHVGLCIEADEVTALLVGEKVAWTGSQTGEGAVYINAPNLFGGPKDQGGVGGTMYFLPGGPNQVMPDSLASRFGLRSATCPGFRGVASVFFTGVLGPVTGSIGTGGTSTGGGTTGSSTAPVSDNSTAAGGGGGGVGGGGASGKTTGGGRRVLD